MRHLVLLSAIIFAILGLVVPARAVLLEEPSAFFALSKLTGVGIAGPSVMSDEQLAAVEGGAACPVCPVIPNNPAIPSIKVDATRSGDSSGSTDSQSNARQTNVVQVNQTTPGGNSTNRADVTQHNAGGADQASTSTQVITVQVLTEHGGTVMVVTQQGRTVTVDTRGITFENFAAALPVQTLLSVNQNVVQTIGELTSPILGNSAMILQRSR